jgi:hypothetical protein
MAALERKFTLHVPSSTQNLAMIRLSPASARRPASGDDVAHLNWQDEQPTSWNTRTGRCHQGCHRPGEFDDERCASCFTGTGFNPATVSQTTSVIVHERKSGGLGLRVMRKLMDEVSYEIVPGNKNRLRMVKRLDK